MIKNVTDSNKSLKLEKAKSDPATFLACLNSHEKLSRDDVSAYGCMSQQEIKYACSTGNEMSREAVANELFMSLAQALITSRWHDEKCGIGNNSLQSDFSQCLRDTPSRTAEAFNEIMDKESVEKHSFVRSWGDPYTTEAEFAITIGDATQVILFQTYKGELIVSDGLCYDQSKQLKALGEAIRTIMGINAGEQQDAELLTTYLQRTKALHSFHSMLNNDDEEAWNRTLVCQEATREIIHSIFSYVSANLDNCGNCEIVAHIDIADTNRQIIFQNYGDAMDIASGVGVVQDENVSALACVIQNTGAVSNGMADIDVVRNLLKNEHVMDHVQHLARKQYRAHVEASDEVIMTEDHGEEGRPIYRLLKVGHTYQIQKCPLLGYKSEWFPALQVTEEFANEAKERVKSHNRNPLLLSNAVNAANRPKNDLRCPCCGAELVFRIASALQMNSKPFWGCSNYPKCRHSHLIEVDQ